MSSLRAPDQVRNHNSWAAVWHWLFAVFNISDYTRFITDMTSETFGFYVGIVYIQKGIELLSKAVCPHDTSRR